MRSVLIPLALVLSAQAAPAATAEGQFAADGIGSQDCAAFVKAAAAEDRQLLGFYASWIEGFMTGVNVFREETFDITPWQTTPLLMGKIRTYCRSHPETGFVVALGRLVSVLAADRLTEASDPVQMRRNGRAVTLPEAVLARVRARVERETGETIATPAGSFDEDFAAAVAGYQAQAGLPRTGLPDQATLNALFP